MASEKDVKNKKNEGKINENRPQDTNSKVTDTPQSLKKEHAVESEQKRKPFWITRSIAEERGREELLRTTLIESLLHAIFVVLVTIYGVSLANTAWYYLTYGLTQQFVERSFQTLNEVEITYYDIRTAADFWFYIENHFIGSIFWESTYAAQSKPDDKNILYENTVLGVPRIRQLKVRNDSCVVHEYFRRMFLSCYDQYGIENEDRATFGPGDSTAWKYSSESVTESIHSWGKIDYYGGGGFFIDLPKSKQETEALFKKLKDNLWITRGTRVIIIDFTTYNANINIFGVCKLMFEFPSSGGVIPTASIRSARLKSYMDAPYNWFIMFIEFLIYFFTCYFIGEGIRDLVYFKLAYFKMFWTYIDLIIISFCITNAVFSVVNLMNDPLTIERYKANPDKYGNFEYFREAHDLQNDVFAVNVFFVYIKVFKYLNFNKTMGQLNNTLRKCAWDILGFSVMFFIIFFAFAELGYLVFGSQVAAFSSFGTAMFTLLRTILGDFQYIDIERTNRILAPIYFLSYIFLVFFVLINMFLAIINDTYADVKTEIAIAPDEMQMTEYIHKGLFKFLRKMGCVRAEKTQLQRELNVTIRSIREALKKCNFSDLEIEMFFSRYNIDPVAEVDQRELEKLLKDLEELLTEKSGMKDGELSDEYVHIDDFSAQQQRLEQIDKTIGMLVTQVKSLLMKLERMEAVSKVKV